MNWRLLRRLRCFDCCYLVLEDQGGFRHARLGDIWGGPRCSGSKLVNRIQSIVTHYFRVDSAAGWRPRRGQRNARLGGFVRSPCKSSQVFGQGLHVSNQGRSNIGALQELARSKHGKSSACRLASGPMGSLVQSAQQQSLLALLLFGRRLRWSD